MISRKEAISVLYGIINGQYFEEELEGKVGKELENALTDIANCIEAEEVLGIHSWGMDDEEWVFLHTAFRTDLHDFEDNKNKQKEILERNRFTPSLAEIKLMEQEKDDE